jgi:hypothetical protein
MPASLARYAISAGRFSEARAALASREPAWLLRGPILAPLSGRYIGRSDMV